MKDFRYNGVGTISCTISHPIYGDIPTTLSKEKSEQIELIRSDIAPYIESVKSSDELRRDIDIKLSRLDASPRTISAAIIGDEFAINKLRELEVEKEALREARKAIG